MYVFYGLYCGKGIFLIISPLNPNIPIENDKTNNFSSSGLHCWLCGQRSVWLDHDGSRVKYWIDG